MRSKILRHSCRGSHWAGLLKLKICYQKAGVKKRWDKISPIREPSDVGVSFAGYALRGGLALGAR